MPVQIPAEPRFDVVAEDATFFDFPKPEQVTTSAVSPDYNFETIFSQPSMFDQLYYAYRLAADPDRALDLAAEILEDGNNRVK